MFGAFADRRWVFVDVETTGSSPARERVTEVGIVTVETDGDARRITEWSTLVNPGVPIPPEIQWLTGISNEMVSGAPDFTALQADILERLSGRLFVAHNARFDYGFLRNEFRRGGLRFRAPVLCTVKLSRRVDPGVRGHNLDAVMARHGLSCSARHRALGDAQVVAGLLASLRRSRGPGELDAIVADLVGEARLPPQLDPELADELPEGPGVYRFYGEDDVLLYVGKSNSLRTRVLAHFAGDHRSGKELRLSRQVRRVDWTETAGELGALLTESRWVKELRPLHNRRLRATGEVWTIQLTGEGEGVHARTVTLGEAGVSAADCHGTFRCERDARRALDELARAHGLCLRALGLERGEGSCFGFQVGRCRGACCGVETPALHAARVRMALARIKLRGWPFGGRIGIVERDWRGIEEIHVFDRWRYLGTAGSLEALDGLLPEADFDLDCYRILCRFLDRPPPRARLLELG
jgi:DNA polymerase-3 subunit epsilon